MNKLDKVVDLFVVLGDLSESSWSINLLVTFSLVTSIVAFVGHSFLLHAFQSRFALFYQIFNPN